MFVNFPSPPTNPPKKNTDGAPPRVRRAAAHQRPHHGASAIHAAARQALLLLLPQPPTPRRRDDGGSHRRLPCGLFLAWPRAALHEHEHESGGRGDQGIVVRGPPCPSGRLRHLPPPVAHPGKGMMEGASQHRQAFTGGGGRHNMNTSHTSYHPQARPTQSIPIVSHEHNNQHHTLTAQPAPRALPPLLPPRARAPPRAPRRAGHRVRR